MNLSCHLFVLIALLLTSSCTWGGKMNETYEFTKVNSLNEDLDRHPISFNTETGKVIFFQNTEIDNPDIQFVRRATAEGKVIFIAYNSATNLCSFAVPFSEDFVRSIEVKQGSPLTLEITLLLRPSYLYLLSTNPRFHELQRILENAKGTEQIVWVGTFPGDAEILDVRLPPP